MPSAVEDYLALSLDSGYVALASVRKGREEPKLVAHAGPAPIEVDSTLRTGYRLVADAEGRAVASLAIRGVVEVWAIDHGSQGDDDALRDPPVMQKSTRINIEGTVIHDACFLLPMPGAGHLLFLVVLYATDEMRDKMTLYSISLDKNDIENYMKACLIANLPLREKEPILFMAPCAYGPGIIVGRERRLELVLYNDLVNGSFEIADCKLPEVPTAWFRDPFATMGAMGPSGGQQIDHAEPDDSLYLASSGGNLYVVQAGDGEIGVELRAKTGVDLGSSFVLRALDLMTDEGEGVVAGDVVDAFLDGQLQDSDVWYLAFGGDMSTGGAAILSVDYGDYSQLSDDEDDEKSQQVRVLVDGSMQLHDNWSPLFDLRALSTRIGGLAPRSELFGATYQMNGTGGAVSRLRYGVPTTLAFPGPEMKRVRRLFSIPERNLLVASYPWKTETFMVNVVDGVPELQDKTRRGLVDSGSETIALGYESLSRSVIQLTRTHVWIGDLGDEMQRSSDSLANVTAGDIKYSWVIAVCGEDEGASVSVFNVVGGSLELQRSVAVEAPISVVRIVVRGTPLVHDAYCILGTYTGKLRLYRLRSTGDGEQFELLQECVFPDKIPHDVYIKGNDMLVSFRDGGYTTGKLEQQGKQLSMSFETDIVTLGTIPVSFMEMPLGNGVLLLAGQMWALFGGDLGLAPWDVLTDRHREIASVCRFPMHGHGNLVAVAANGKLKVYSLGMEVGITVARTDMNSPERQPQSSSPTPTPAPTPPRQPAAPTSLGDASPRRLQYLEHSGVFAVAMTGGTEVGRTIGHIAFMDPYRDEIVSRGLVIGGKRATKVFDPAERVQCMCEWTLQANGARYSYLVVGTSTKPGEYGPGQIVILRVKRTHDGILQVTCQHRWPTEAGVLAIAPLGDNAIAYSTGAAVPRLHVSTINLGDGTGRLQFVSYRYDKLPSAAVHLTTADDRIFASTMKHSVAVLKWTGASLELTHSDPVLRSMVTHINVDADTVLAADKNGYVVCLTLGDTALETAFYVRLPSLVSRIVPLEQAPPWSRLGANRSFVMAGLDGSLYGLRITETLDSSTWFNIASMRRHWSTTVRPFSPLSEAGKLFSAASRNPPSSGIVDLSPLRFIPGAYIRHYDVV